MSGDKDEKVYLAKLAEQAERYDGKTLVHFECRESVCASTGDG